MQQKAGCIIGKDYPFPILDEQAEKARCIARIKNAYSAGFHGDSPEVLDGSAFDTLEAKHEETGAGKVKDEKERSDDKAEAKRKRDGDQSIDGFFDKKPKSKVKKEEKK